VGLPFEYEKEGFDLGDGIWYLPDFWLPSLKLWVEIKDGGHFADRIKNKAYTYYPRGVFERMRKFRDSQSWPVSCIIGQPGNHRICHRTYRESVTAGPAGEVRAWREAACQMSTGQSFHNYNAQRMRMHGYAFCTSWVIESMFYVDAGF
jgi:hypothetical protein